MKLHPITSNGISAFCTDIIVDPNQPEVAYLLSVCGYQAAVKGIIANILEDESVRIEMGDTSFELIRSPYNYQIQFRKLPSGKIHGILYPKFCIPGKEDQRERFVIFTRDPQEVSKLFFRHLDDATDLPLHPSWTPWLWNAFCGQDNWLNSFKTLIGSYIGYFVMFDPARLKELVSDAIKNKDPEIIKCLNRRANQDAASSFS